MLRTPIAAALIVSMSSLAVTACGEDADSSDRQEAVTGADPSRAEIYGKVVDDKGLPVAEAAVSILAMRQPDKQESVATSEDGTFRWVLDSPSPRFAALIARSANQSYQGLVRLNESNTLSRVAKVEVTLRPARRLAVEVVDETGRPVAGARVGVIASYQPVSETVTGRTGIASMLIPPDAEVDWIIAFKAGAGFDYFENYHAFPTSGRPIPPEAVRLTLRGSRRIDIKVVDSEDRPLQDVRLRPWTIQTPGRISYANLSGVPLVDATTDRSGMARFDWIPAPLDKDLVFFAIHEAYHCPERIRLLADDSASDLLTARVLRKAHVAGTVVHQDGTPAVGILLQIEGHGETIDYFRGYARTDRDGRYELDVEPNQWYIAGVISDDWAAPAHVGFALGEGERRAGVDFRLSRGTIIRGTIMVGPDAEPAAGETVTLVQQGSVGIGGSDNRELKLVRWAMTENSGEYRLRVGPGVYELRLPHSADRETLTIAGVAEPEMTRDHHFARRPRGVLRGRVLRGDRQPEINALVYGESIGVRKHVGFTAVCGAEGRFETDRWRDEMVVYARSRDGTHAGFTRIIPDADEVLIELRPAAVAVGRVLDPESRPVADVRVICSVEIPGNETTYPIRFDTRTDSHGRFQFGGLVMGARCVTGTYHGPEHTHTAGPQQQISAPVRFDIGTILIEAPKRD